MYEHALHTSTANVVHSQNTCMGSKILTADVACSMLDLPVLRVVGEKINHRNEEKTSLLCRQMED